MDKIFFNLIGFCWLIFIFFWLISALRTKPVAERQSVLSGIWYRVFMIVAVFLLFFQGVRNQSFSGSGRHLDLTWSVLSQRVIVLSSNILLTGLIITILGLLLALWARVTLGGNWSSTVTFKHEHQLLQTGPYAFVRHPIYTAFLLMFLGTAMAYGTWGSLFSFPFAFLSFWLKLNQEEQLMLKHFPADYTSYQQRVKRLIPFIL